jgi:hypothetical protein
VNLFGKKPSQLKKENPNLTITDFVKMNAIAECLTAQNFIGLALLLGMTSEMIAEVSVDEFTQILAVRLADFQKKIEAKAKAQGWSPE